MASGFVRRCRIVCRPVAVVLGLLAFFSLGAIVEAKPPVQPAAKYHLKRIYGFRGGADGQQLVREPIADAAGRLFGSFTNGGACGQGAIGMLSPRRQPDAFWTFKNLHSFTPCRRQREEWNPISIVFGPDGAIYGLAYYRNGFEGGALFRLKPDAGSKTWTYQRLGSVKSRNRLDTLLTGGIAVGPDGSVFCLTTSAKVVKFSPSAAGEWPYEFIASFGTDETSELATPNAYNSGGLSTDANGDVYGVATVVSSAASTSRTFAFKLEPPVAPGPLWTAETLHEFDDDASSQTPLLVAPDGTLFGTISQSNRDKGGFVFSLAPAGGGSTYSVIHKFKDQSAVTGSHPLGALALVGGSVFGVTRDGGGGAFGTGDVFKLTPAGAGWKKSTAYDFEGEQPNHGFAISPDGRLFIELLTSGFSSIYELER